MTRFISIPLLAIMIFSCKVKTPPEKKENIVMTEKQVIETNEKPTIKSEEVENEEEEFLEEETEEPSLEALIAAHPLMPSQREQQDILKEVSTNTAINLDTDNTYLKAYFDGGMIENGCIRNHS